MKISNDQNSSDLSDHGPSDHPDATCWISQDDDNQNCLNRPLQTDQNTVLSDSCQTAVRMPFVPIVSPMIMSCLKLNGHGFLNFPWFIHTGQVYVHTWDLVDRHPGRC